LFKVERGILRVAVSKPSTHEQVTQLAHGEIQHFAAWTVEQREENEILLCDFSNRTRSWLMVESLGSGERPRTRLYFGSVVVPVAGTKPGQSKLGFPFHALLGFHKLYSRALFSAAKQQLLAELR